MERVEFYSPENIQTERLLLLDVQSQNQKQLVESGLVMRALKSISYYNITNLTRYAVALKEEHSLDEKLVIARLRFMTPQLNPCGEIITPYRYLDIAADSGEGREAQRDLKNDFTYDDADQAFEMLAKLGADKYFGPLEHLSDDRTEILAPLQREQRDQSPLRF